MKDKTSEYLWADDQSNKKALKKVKTNEGAIGLLSF